MPGPSSAVPNGNIKNLFVLQVSVAAGAPIATATTVERTYTVQGLRVGDIVTAIKPQLDAGLAMVNARVSAIDTLALQFANVTAGPLSITASNYLLLVSRSVYDNPTVQIPTAIA